MSDIILKRLIWARSIDRAFDSYKNLVIIKINQYYLRTDSHPLTRRSTYYHLSETSICRINGPSPKSIAPSLLFTIGIHVFKHVIKILL